MTPLSRWIFGCGLGLAAACLAIYLGLGFETYSGRYRLTLKVDVGSSTRSGSSIIEVTWRIPRPLFRAILTAGASIQGTAPTIDITPYGRLFAMLSPSGDPSDGASLAIQDIAQRAFGSPSGALGDGASGRDDPARQRAGSAPANGMVELGVGSLPQIAWLPNKDDPLTARRVNPADFPVGINPSVRFHGATIAITREPATRELKQRFPELVQAIPEKWERHGALRGQVFRLLLPNLEQ